MNFLQRLFASKPKRLIFTYHDGHKERQGDPVAIAHALANDPDYLRRLIGQALDGENKAITTLGEIASRVFRVRLIHRDGDGLTLAQCVDLIVSFETFCESLKKNMRRSVSSRRYTDATSSDSSEPTTNDSQPSISVKQNPESDSPKSSGSEPQHSGQNVADLAGSSL